MAQEVGRIKDLLVSMRSSVLEQARIELEVLRTDSRSRATAKRIIAAISKGTDDARVDSLLINQVMLGALVRKEFPALAQFWIGPRVKARPQINLGNPSPWAPREQVAKSQARDLGLIAALVLEADLAPFHTENEVFSVDTDNAAANLSGAVADATRELAAREPTALLTYAEHYEIEWLQIANSVVTQNDRQPIPVGTSQRSVADGFC